jgi:hypothetical protein
LTGILAGWGSLEELATENSAGEFIKVFSSAFSHVPPFLLLAELNVRLFALGSADLREFAIVFGNCHKSYERLPAELVAEPLAVGR